MKTIWAFLNAPVIVAFEAAILMAVLVVLGFRNISKALNADNTRSNRIVALSKIEIVSFSEAPTSPAEPQKFIGTIKNHSSFILREISGSACFYSEDGKLTNVFTNRLDGIGTLAPDGSREFALELRRDRDSAGSEPKIAGFKMELKIVDVEIENK